MNFIRIFSDLNVWLTMIPIVKTTRLHTNRSICFFALGSLILSGTGCQKLFHAQDALLNGQSVTVSMTVPDVPLSAVKPLEQVPPQTSLQKKPVAGALDNRLLPKQAPPSTDPLLVKIQADPAKAKQIKPAREAIIQADTIISGKTVAEDMVLRGTVLIRGSLVVAPQATLRIDPGTHMYFAPAAGSDELPHLVIQGRIVAAGTAQHPIVCGPAFSEAVAGDWGGVVLLNSEKKNSFDFCRIQGAQTGITASFSRFTGRGFSITRSQSGVALYDSEASLQGSTISRCDVAYRLSDSELDLRDSAVHENRQGVYAQRSSFTMTSVKITNNSQEGIVAEQCRFRLTGSLLAENRSGARFTGGDGQFFLCRFYQNRENGVMLTGVRIRINNSTFARNTGTGLVIDNVRGSVVGSVFSENKAGNLQNRGNELFSALLNWWGNTDEKQIAAGILDPARSDDVRLIPFVPFLKERPATAP
jgi:hypothetical protein